MLAIAMWGCVGPGMETRVALTLVMVPLQYPRGAAPRQLSVSRSSVRGRPALGDSGRTIVGATGSPKVRRRSSYTPAPGG